MNKKIAIVDCDSFYCSVEELFSPSSKGKPICVLSNNDGCVIARNKLAKELGIKMGEPFFQKRDFMEQHRFQIFSSNYNLYGDISDRVMSVIKRYAKNVEVYSIDECFIDLSDIPDNELTNKLHLIRNEVKRLVGIPVSIGVGPNKTLAKLTSKIAKKQPTYDGVCSYWSLENLNTLLYKISVEDVWGIGRKWAKKLNAIGVDSVGQLLNTDDRLIKKLMNINGLKTKMEIQGYYCFEIKENPKMKRNIASTRSFGEDINDFGQVAEAMYSYIQNGIKKLKDNEISPNKVTIFVCGNFHKGQKHFRSKQVTLQTQTRDITEIWSQIYPHLRKLYDQNKSYKKCGIIFNNLMPENIKQGTLFSEQYQSVIPPTNTEKKWEMRQDFLTQKYTTDWEQIPTCFV